jgi:hypothetical protein
VTELLGPGSAPLELIARAVERNKRVEIALID